MTFIEVTTLVLQLLIPLGLIVRVGLPRHRARVDWGLDVALATAYIAAIAVAGLWLALPPSLPIAYAAALLVAAPMGFARVVPAGHQSRWSMAATWARGLVTLSLALVAVYAVSGRRPFEEPALDLVFPLRGGTYLVATGGTNVLVNPHLETLSAERFARYTGQSYAVDLVKLGKWGSRTAGLSPDDPSGFAIFADTLHAPCSGVVVRSKDGLPDVYPAAVVREDLEGNHVILSCGAAWVVLAHMKLGSVSVQEGDTVQVGDRLGLVGSSGQSDEPHLHIHAQTPGSATAPLAGKPIPITFDGRHLARSDRVRAPQEDPQ